MQQIELIVVCLLVGVLLRLSGRMPETAPKALGGWVINVALPATALRTVHDLDVDASWWLAAATPWIGALLAVAVLAPLGRACGWSRQRTGALMLVAGWGNTSFVGLPMIAAFAGPQWLGLGILIDLFGSYLALSILGIGIATVASAGRFEVRAVVRRIATFPPFLAILVAFATNHLERPEWITDVVGSLADTLTPIALAAVGLALRLDRFAGRIGALAVGLGWRLVAAPAAILLLAVVMGAPHDPVARIAILEMAMPPSLGASIIAIEHDLEPDLVALMIGLGVPLAILTSALWWELLRLL
jgi:hypothetical protein